ncbi:M48 family metallopeptidase [Nocardioides sp. ChNu-153]|uniref:M48 metallopeptidase family protein n=1 Tax=unclassified Nocardioides TaxID=2615069 RepID=UPI00264A5A33|nr:M48 family metallopeptidase [Nocardioides sp. ChNu-153]
MEPGAGPGADRGDVTPDGTGRTGARPDVEVRRSRRRRRTVSAYREGGRIVVLVPAALSDAEIERWVAEMVRRIERSDARARPSDDELLGRARRLSDRYLGGMARPASVRWVDNQRSRWGSCTPGDSTIRLSSRLQGMPAWVVDYVLVHELAHLLVPGHDADFWAWVAHYPHAERAKGYLLGYSAAGRLEPPPGEEPDDLDDPADPADPDGFDALADEPGDPAAGSASGVPGTD